MVDPDVEGELEAHEGGLEVLSTPVASGGWHSRAVEHGATQGMWMLFCNVDPGTALAVQQATVNVDMVSDRWPGTYGGVSVGVDAACDLRWSTICGGRARDRGGVVSGTVQIGGVPASAP